MATIGLAGVIIWTGNLDVMREFYQEKLGLTPHSVRPNFIAFKWGDVRFSIGEHSAVRGRSPDPHHIMVNLATDDIHGDYERLRSHGVRFIRPPEREHWGGWVATFEDPDGNILQLLEMGGG